MIGTESKLWALLDSNVSEHYRTAHFSRIESAITPGCSDIHYAMTPWAGWIELKTASPPREGKALALHSPFTFAQASWLLNNNETADHQRSWMLIGILGARTWKGFVLVQPVPALKLLKVRKGEAFDKFLLRAGVYQEHTMKDVLKRIRSNGP